MSFDDGAPNRNTHTVSATSGGRIDLSGLDTIAAPTRSEDIVQFVVQGALSELDLSSLQTFNGNGQARFDIAEGSLMLGSFENGGTLTARQGGNIDINGSFTQTTGSTTLQDGTLDITGVSNLQGGAIVGSGIINTLELTNDSLINPGNGVGTLDLNGDYTQTGNGLLNIELGGDTAGEFDQLLISGTASLAGTLNVSLVNNYTPEIGDSFEVLNFSDRIGDFTTINLPTLPAGLDFQAQFDANRLLLTVI
ncbi:MAG: hypothetical protein F6K21_18315 [Symploca sp. SIO2D2]|nr:hypothetical protein [Symploca sp. SIO2D2]